MIDDRQGTGHWWEDVLIGNQRDEKHGYVYTRLCRARRGTGRLSATGVSQNPGHGSSAVRVPPVFCGPRASGAGRSVDHLTPSLLRGRQICSIPCQESTGCCLILMHVRHFSGFWRSIVGGRSRWKVDNDCCQASACSCCLDWHGVQ